MVRKKGSLLLFLVVLLSSLLGMEQLFAQGEVSFRGRPRRDYGVGSYPNFTSIGDFNGDNKPDLAVSNGVSDDVSILLGNGDGTFQPARNLRVGRTPYCVIVGDFNGDGFQDLATANESTNDVSILLGNGNGTFQPARSFMVGQAPRAGGTWLRYSSRNARTNPAHPLR